MNTISQLQDTVIGTITAVNGQIIIPVQRYAAVSIRAILTGVTSGNFSFTATADGLNDDGSDGDWTLDVMGARSNAANVENTSGALSATPVYSWDAGVGGYNFIKIKATAGTFGSAKFIVTRYREGAPTIPTVMVNGTTAVSGTVSATPTAASRFSLTAAATANATSVKTSGGDLMVISWTNYSAGSKFLKLYNKASAPTVGTDIPVLTIPLAATSSGSLNFGAQGQRFDTGIAYAITGAITDADTTPLAAGDVKILGTYK